MRVFETSDYAQPDRYTVNSYTRGHIGYSATAGGAWQKLGTEGGYVFDTHLHCTVVSQPQGGLRDEDQ